MQQLTDISLSGIVLGLGSVVWQLGLPKKLVPVCDIIIGVVIQFLVSNGEIHEKILGGIMLGLTAAGMYSGTKNVAEHINNNKGV